MLSGAFLAGTALAHVEMALHHGLCHVLGGSAGVPHGEANAIILPHALRFNLEATAPQVAQAAGVMDKGPGTRDQTRSATDDAVEVITGVETLIRKLNLPRRLRDAGVRHAELPRLAELALESKAVRHNPRPIAGAEQIQGILEAAW
jgi:alcohol dehydrogenase